MKFTIKESSLDIAERINYALGRAIENAASQIRPKHRRPVTTIAYK
jgi:hypothetical protein